MRRFKRPYLRAWTAGVFLPHSFEGKVPRYAMVLQQALMRHPSLSFGGAALLGWGALSAVWLTAWDNWAQAQAAHDQQRAQQAALQTLTVQTEQMRQSAASPVWADVGTLIHLAQQQGMRLSHLQMQPPTHPVAWQTLPTSVRPEAAPVQLRLQGPWRAWQQWLAQWPSAAPGVVVSALALKADSRAGLRVEVDLVTPKEAALAPASAPKDWPTAAPNADPFDASAWTAAQRLYGQRHPSYARWVAPELARPRDWLEAYPLARLRYVGLITAEATQGASTEVLVTREVKEALVRVLPEPGAKASAALTSVYRVRVGQYLGHDFGRVKNITPAQIQLRELVHLPNGEWQTRDASLVLQESRHE